MKTIKSEIYNKYTLNLNSFETGGFSVMVLNNNANLYNQTVCHYSFKTQAEAENFIAGYKAKVDTYEEMKAERKAERLARRKTETPITAIVKKALAEKYGFKNVRVNRGSGTAYGWVEASVYIDQPAPTCENCKNSTYGRCYTCGNVYNHYTKEATEIVYKAMEKADKKFYTYYSDDYSDNRPRDEFLLDINFKK